MSGGRADPAHGFGLAPPRRPPPASNGPGRPELVALLREEIRHSGPITFARFMQRALYEPGLGYYAAAPDRPTRAGDFLTAPELHPLFGHAIARQMDEMWQLLGRPHSFVVREYGAGTGTLGLTILQGLAAMHAPSLEAVRYQPVEIPGRLGIIRDRLAGAGLARHLDEPASAEGIVGCVLANEFLDALPVHRVVQRGTALREVYVDFRDERFVEAEGDLSSPDLDAWFGRGGIELADGQRAEVNLGLVRWVGEVAAALRRGYAIVIDYGAEPAALYGPDRRTGTMRAFREQHVSSDPYVGVGEQDLTAHVDLAALRRAAEGSGLTVLGTTSQAEFLVGCGLEELLVAEQAALPDEWQPRLLLRSAVARLVDPRQTGGYAVVVVGRDVPAEPPLRGLAFRLPARG
jgi:SAM-dependent MidA family methyltransferase